MEVVQSEGLGQSARSLGRALIVEDEPLISMMLEQVVEELGYQVVGTATTLADARRLVRSRSPEIVLLDRYVHGKITVELADELIQRNIALVLMVTTEAEHIPPQHQGVPYLVKPFADRDLEKAMRISKEFARKRADIQ